VRAWLAEPVTVNPQDSVLIVVDVQNDFVHDDGVFGKTGLDLSAMQASVDNLLPLIDAAHAARVPVIFIKTHHDAWNNSPAFVERFVRKSAGAEICATGTWGADYYRVRPTAGDHEVVKHRYSAFVGTSLEVVLRALGRPTVLVTGVTTNVCVESTVRDACMRDYRAVLIADCAGAPTKDEHASAVHNVRTYFGTVTDSTTVMTVWRRSAQ
jgi:ureidoacrylate peracid hydrolase